MSWLHVNTTPLFPESVPAWDLQVCLMHMKIRWGHIGLARMPVINAMYSQMMIAFIAGLSC